MFVLNLTIIRVGKPTTDSDDGDISCQNATAVQCHKRNGVGYSQE